MAASEDSEKIKERIIEKIQLDLLGQIEKWNKTKGKDVPILYDFCVICTNNEDDVVLAQRFMQMLGTRGLTGCTTSNIPPGKPVFEYLEELYSKSKVLFVIVSATFREDGFHRLLTEETLYRFKKQLIPICEFGANWIADEFVLREFVKINLKREEDKKTDDKIILKLCQHIFNDEYQIKIQSERRQVTDNHNNFIEQINSAANEETKKFLFDMSQLSADQLSSLLLQQIPKLKSLSEDQDI